VIIQTLQGDCREVLKTLPAESVNCVVTSPPYFGLRDYGVDGQIGLEETPAEYVAALVEVFREVKRVLRADGNVWLNLGDSYSSGAMTPHAGQRKDRDQTTMSGLVRKPPENLGHKQLLGIPWRVAFALQDDGWYLRSDIIWAKPNPMPESVTDRPTRSHEYIFLLTKSAKYYYDAEAIKEPANFPNQGRWGKDDKYFGDETMKARKLQDFVNGETRNKRTVWTVATQPYKESHFATFPEKLIEPCILAGCPAGGTVLDPFGGSGTTGRVAARHGRDAILVELNPKYAELITTRTDKIQKVMPLFS